MRKRLKENDNSIIKGHNPKELPEKKEEIVKELPFDMNNMDLEIAFSEHIDLNKFDNGQEKSSYDWKANEEESKPQTKLLYKVAEIFVKAFSDV